MLTFGLIVLAVVIVMMLSASAVFWLSEGGFFGFMMYWFTMDALLDFLSAIIDAIAKSGE